MVKSLLLHFVIGCLLFLHIKEGQTVVGNHSMSVVQARLLDSESLITSQEVIERQGVTSESGMYQSHHHQKNKQAVYAQQLSIGMRNIFLQKLHDAIAKVQYYPDAAAELGQHGNVEVAFVLTQQGDIVNERVVSTSGFSSLDGAAIEALKRIASFPLAKKYLKHDEYFSLVISFF